MIKIILNYIDLQIVLGDIMSNYVKLEYKDGVPTLGMSYDSSTAFRELMMTLFSPTSHFAFYDIIMSMLIKQDADPEDIAWLENFYKITEKFNEDELLIKKSRTLMRPSSFR